MTHVRGVGSLIRQRLTSSLPKTIMSKINVWGLRSTQPHCFISFRRALVASSAMSSGGTPGWDTASEQWIAEVVDSASKLRAYPGDLSAKMHQYFEFK